MTRDDLGAPFELRRPASRVVSLVPSLTESVTVAMITEQPAARREPYTFHAKGTRVNASFTS
jgi:hypothetical protein